ncbi:hypothetical protein ACJIZ3_025437 [Penstemon smallii]|uniref:Uncharacterized protein n=1 Tax=Penstemon smallii TaxID=265156 RepID=A0ABD3TUM1_9LAMI
MNSPTPLPTQQAIWGLKDGYFMIQNQTLDVVTMRTHDASFLAVEEGVRFRVSSAVEIDENDYVENKERVEVEFVEEDEVNSEGPKQELLGNENEDNADISDRVAENEGVVAGEFAQLIDVDGYEKEVEALNHCSKVDNAVMTEAAENEVVGGDKVESEIDSFQQLLVGVRTDESEYFGGHGLEEDAKDFQEQFEVLDDIDSVEEQIGSQEESLEVDEIGYDNEGEMEKSGLNTSMIIGVSVVSIILASIAFLYHSNKARSTSSAQQAQPVLEKETTPLPTPIEKKVEFFARPSFRPPMEEAPKELNHNINVPTVKLIGEIDVGELSSSLRSCGSKYEMMESEESNTTSFFPKKSSVPQPFSSSPTQPSPMEISTTSSHSHGSFTTEMKIVKKEGGKNGKAKIEVVTPVRRSSRLRNRDSVMSSP